MRPFGLLILAFAICPEANGQWNEILSGASSTKGPQILALSSSPSGKIFAGTMRGIFTSTNNGASWAPANTGLTTGPVNAFAVAGGYVYVAMNSYDRVLRSSDDGLTWVHMNTGLPEFAVVRMGAVGTKVFGLCNNGAYYSIDVGDPSWTEVTNGPSNVSNLVSTQGKIYLGTATGVHLSINGGTSWAPVNNGLTNLNVIHLSASGDFVHAWTSGGTFFSSNSGTTWSSGQPGFQYTTIAHNGTTLIASAQFVPTRISTNSGSTWSDLSPLPDGGGLAIATGNYFYVSTDDGAFVSPDVGQTWSPSYIGMSCMRGSLSADGPSILFTNGSNVYVSINRGTSWSTPSVGAPGAQKRSVLVQGNNWLVANLNGNYRSVNNGVSWPNIATLQSDMTLGGEAASLFACDSYTVNKSVSGGSAWAEKSTIIRWVSAVASKDNKVFTGSAFSGDDYTGVFASTNSGETFAQVNNTLPQINAMAYNGSLLVCGTVSGVYTSVNDGGTWTLTSLNGVNVHAVVFNNGKIYAGHRGVSVSEDNGLNWSPLNDDILASLGTYHEVTGLANSGTRVIASTSAGSVWISNCVTPPTPGISGDWTHTGAVLTSNAATNNQWFRNGVAIGGATGATHTTSSSGIYTVQVNIDGCASTASSAFVITDCLLPDTPVISLSGSEENAVLSSSASAGNQWFLDGALIPGAISQSFEPEVAGEYTVFVALDGCPGVMSETFVVDLVTGLDRESVGIKLYPNPANANLTISLASLDPGAVDLKVLNLYGQQVFGESINGGHAVTIPVSHLLGGLYIVEANQSGRVYRQKFAKGW